MNYASPELTPVCRCLGRGSPIAPTFCPTGHMTECHFPLECEAAACSHLPRYDEEYDPAKMAQLEELAVDHLRGLANPDCIQCHGEGWTEVTRTIALPEGFMELLGTDVVGVNNAAICPCVSGRIIDTQAPPVL